MAEKPTSDLSFMKHVKDDNSKCDVECAKSAMEPFPLQFQPTVLWSPYKDREQTHYNNIIESKRKYLTEINGLKAEYKKVLAEYNSILVADKLEKMQEVWKKDPDPYFNSDYNWYYTGGTLSVQKTSYDDSIVYYPTSKCGLKIARFHKGNQLFAARKFTTEDTIFQTECHFGCYHKLAIRHKDKCSLYVVCMRGFNHRDYDILLDRYDIKLTKYPLSGMCLNRYYIILADVKYSLAVFDHLTEKPVTLKKVESSSDNGNNFTQLESLTEQTFAQLNYARLNLWDIRQMEPIKLLKKKGYPFGCMNKGNYEEDLPFIYVITTKDIQTIDIRMRGVINKVSHSIVDTPFMSAFAGKATEYVAFSSHDPQEKVILGRKDKTYYTPLQIGDASEFLQKETLKNPDTIRYSKLKRRLLDNVTGFGMSMHDVINLYTVNTLGDLTVYTSNKLNSSSLAEEKKANKVIKDKEPTSLFTGSSKKPPKGNYVFTSSEEEEDDPAPVVIVDKLAKRYAEFETDPSEEKTSLKRKNKLVENVKSKAKHLRKSVKRDFSQAWETENLPGADTGEVNTREKIHDWFRRMDVDKPE